MDLQGKRCMVFGSNGYIGRHLVHAMAVRGAAVHSSDIQEYSWDLSIPYTRVDITDGHTLDKIDWNVDSVFVFAGMTGTHKSFGEYERFLAVNELGLLNILTRIKNSGSRPRIVFPSTRLVYKGSGKPLKEEDEKEAKTVYAVNKLACELMLGAFRNSFDIDHTIYRICIPYGNNLGSDYSYGTIGFFINQAISHREISLYGDGSLRRSFTHIEDVCSQIIDSCISEKSRNETYNLIGEDYSLFEIASLIANQYNASVRSIEWPEHEKGIESGHTVFDGSKLQKMFGFRLKNQISDWLLSTRFR